MRKQIICIFYIITTILFIRICPNLQKMGEEIIPPITILVPTIPPTQISVETPTEKPIVPQLESFKEVAVEETTTEATTVPMLETSVTKQAIDIGNPVPELYDDNNTYNGYWWYDEGWVPGLATFDTQFLRMPTTTIGSAVIYAPGVMEATAKYRGLSLDGFIGSVALPFCSEIGHSIWIQRPGYDWEGPFIVADCSRRNDVYAHIEFRDQVVEVDFNTAVRWGMARYGGKDNDGRWTALTGRLDGVIVSKNPPELYDGNIIDLSTWFLNQVTFAKQSENRNALQNYIPPDTYQKELGIDNRGNPYPMWLLYGKWIVFE